MRSKAPLAMMEQMVMLLVFALAAALCLQAFVKSDAISAQGEARDHAMVEAQSAAEVIRSCQGDLTRAAELLGAEYQQGLLWLDYGEDWNPGGGETYRLTAQGFSAEVDGMGAAHVAVEQGGTEEPLEVLFQLDVAWQEVSGHD